LESEPKLSKYLPLGDGNGDARSLCEESRPKKNEVKMLLTPENMKSLASHVDQRHAEVERTTKRMLLTWVSEELDAVMRRKTARAYLGRLGLPMNKVKAKKRTLGSYRNDAAIKFHFRLA
jgi:intergrase/recombinase